MKKKQFIMAITIIILSAGSKSLSQQGGRQAVNNQKTNKKMETSTTEKNKATVRNIFELALNRKKMELLKDLIDDEYKGPRGGSGHEAFLLGIQPMLVAFPDIEWKIEDIIGEGNTVMIRIIWQGTHKGPFNKYAASGKTITNEGMAVYKLKNGKVISSTAFPDRLGFFQQIGIVPADL